jgi:hypothetical protein
MEPDRGAGRRVAPVVAAFALVLAAVWLVATLVPLGSEPQPAVGPEPPAAVETPAVAEPPAVVEPPAPVDRADAAASARVGFVGLPPEGATPSRPRDGEVVLSYFGQRFTHWYEVWVYADGRMIWQREGDLREGANEYATGFLEQRLTPRGVALLMRRGSAEDALFGFPWRPPYPASWLPPRAWEDRAIRAFVPSRYAVCYQGLWRPIPASRILGWLPAPASELLRAGAAAPTSVAGLLRGSSGGCSVVTTDDARAVAAAFQDGAFRQDLEFREMYALTYHVRGGGAVRNEAAIRFDPILPHGEAGCTSCG